MKINTIVEANKLTKCFREQEAVKALDLKVLKGRVYGLLELNCAGKTPPLKMLVDNL